MHARTFLLFLTGLLMLAPSAVACRIPWIEPVPPHPHPQVSVRPALQPLVTQRHVAEIEIAEGIANIAISVRFHNPNHQQVEGTYFLPIEADAVVRDFEMIMDGKSLKAELLEADQARRIYEEIVRKMKDPGLLEYVGGRMLEICKEKGTTFCIERGTTLVLRVLGGKDSLGSELLAEV